MLRRVLIAYTLHKTNYRNGFRIDATRTIHGIHREDPLAHRDVIRCLMREVGEFRERPTPRLSF